MNSNCSNLLDMRNLQEQVKKAFCYQKIFWPFTVWINCFSDLNFFCKFLAFSLEFQKFFSVTRTSSWDQTTNPESTNPDTFFTKMIFYHLHLLNKDVNDQTSFDGKKIRICGTYLIFSTFSNSRRQKNLSSNLFPF